MGIRGWYITDEQSPNLTGESGIKQTLLPEARPSFSVGVETPVAALRASGSVWRHIARRGSRNDSLRERRRDEAV
ncbi:hypothetical protein CesoFtcFv8_001096 [Champsocephalus esox]|uniref:Uncharacterized protein n=1 Tax=Champsocephalus esox TaxID=159716 RepID=A0AAN8D546_9TELE|nr:hypothetical protein CesoFtcFv8_001096 [Champsocephalus esox]